VASLAFATLLAAGCGGAQQTKSAEPAPYYKRAEPPTSRASIAPRPPERARPVRARGKAAPSLCASPKTRPLRTGALAFAAIVRTNAAAHVRPGGPIVGRYARLNVNGVPTVFGVLARARCGGEWLRVQLPTRPNGVLGWVRAGDVELVRVRTRIEVDLSTRRVTLYRGGRELIATTAAIGAADTPTPTGSYYVNQRLVAPDPSGPFGPAAIGISAFSPVLQDWIQGGPIAIHGTNRPDLLGGAVSHGCIRVRNDVLARMFSLAVAGTPVVIRA
jgi:L,D-transpeptidase catalytic domain